MDVYNFATNVKSGNSSGLSNEAFTTNIALLRTCVAKDTFILPENGDYFKK